MTNECSVKTLAEYVGSFTEVKGVFTFGHVD